ncbi:MAG: putative membrane protein YphA (DoxX/SURF4 family) [Mariniblastus sp.]|jgi:uncharacterized membrane protein YphA (DoxX/SURF4 family)
MLLRIVVGYHFFKEGTSKLKYGFSSYGFLASAKGPLSPYFKGMLDDPDGIKKLCIKETVDDVGGKSYSIDPELTLSLWDAGFLNEASEYYGFGSETLEAEIVARRDSLAEQIRAARDSQDKSVNTAKLEKQRRVDEASIKMIREQGTRVNQIFESHKSDLIDWLSGNEVELISHFSTANRLDGFVRDGENRDQAALFVDSLRGQVGTIASDRKKKLAGWSAEVTAMWDSFESQINSLAVDKQAKLPKYVMHRHFDQENSMSKWIDRIIPWFDTIVGVLLILGLFTRLASLSAALFLVSVILTQPPWLPGTQPTYFYFIEMMALLVVFATCAGRMGGLDYFFSNPTVPAQNELEEQA